MHQDKVARQGRGRDQASRRSHYHRRHAEDDGLVGDAMLIGRGKEGGRTKGPRRIASSSQARHDALIPIFGLLSVDQVRIIESRFCFLADMKHLETLSFANCRIVILPQTPMGQPRIISPSSEFSSITEKGGRKSKATMGRSRVGVSPFASMYTHPDVVFSRQSL